MNCMLLTRLCKVCNKACSESCTSISTYTLSSDVPGDITTSETVVSNSTGLQPLIAQTREIGTQCCIGVRYCKSRTFLSTQTPPAPPSFSLNVVETGTCTGRTRGHHYAKVSRAETCYKQQIRRNSR